jgi:hypothetical protein
MRIRTTIYGFKLRVENCGGYDKSAISWKTCTKHHRPAIKGEEIEKLISLEYSTKKARSPWHVAFVFGAYLV